MDKQANNYLWAGIPAEIQPVAPERRKTSKADVVLTAVWVTSFLAYFIYDVFDEPLRDRTLAVSILLAGVMIAGGVYVVLDIVGKYRRGEEIQGRFYRKLTDKKEKS